MNKKLAIAMLPLVLVAACRAPESDTAAPAAAQDAPRADGQAPDAGPQAGWDFAAPAADDVSLTISPDPVDFCDGGTRSVTVRWEIARSYASPQIWAQPGVKAKLFSAPSDRASEEETGDWVKQDTTFYLVDAATGRVLKQVKPTPAPCP